MSKGKRPSFAFWTGVALGGILGTPIAYLALLGPVAFLCVHGTLTEADWNIAAYPVLWWADNVGKHPEWLCDAYESYLGWWAGLARMHF